MKEKYFRTKISEKLGKISGHKKIWVSGGVDSMSLLHAINRRSDITVVHFNHGYSDNYRYRLLAQELVIRKVEEYGLPFELHEYTGGEQSETALRKFRNNTISIGDNIVTAHHADDLFETRIIRLIRGSPIEALDIESSSIKHMPMIEFNKDQIREYANIHDIEYLEDPTNTHLDNLRNYIRNEMIPSLSDLHPNFQLNMSKTIEDILKKKEGLS